MKFRTEINLPNYPFSIAYPNNIFSIGSCFASNMANQLQRLKFQVTDNPYGTLFNPISIANGLNLLLHNYEFSEHDLFTHQGLWHSYHHHSSFSGIDQTAVLNHLQYNSQQARTHLLNSDRILITLGSAYVHQHTTWGGIVANCHKLPANQFTKSKLGVSDITSAFVPVLEALKAQLPNLAILLTVSPVRHIKEGLVENQRSKATLLLAAEALCQFDFVHYFPAYEIMMDDLRDYRFYAADLIHPSEVAIQYIWEKFGATFFDAATQQQIAAIEKLLQAIAHRPFQPNAPAHQLFLQQQLANLAAIESQYPTLNLEVERRFLRGD